MAPGPLPCPFALADKAEGSAFLNFRICAAERLPGRISLSSTAGNAISRTRSRRPHRGAVDFLSPNTDGHSESDRLGRADHGRALAGRLGRRNRSGWRHPLGIRLPGGGSKKDADEGSRRKLIDSCGNDANAPPERRLPRNPGGPQGGRRRSLRRISGKPLAARKNRPQQPDSLRPDPECAASDPGRAAAPDRNPADQRKTAGSLTDTIYE